MSNGTRYTFVFVILILGGVGAYAYITSPTKLPSTVVSGQGEGMTGGATMSDSSVGTASGTTMTPSVADGRYRIVPEQTTASFSLDEDLRGKRITVLGTTNQVSGAVKVDPANLAAVEFGTIRINARTFVTDDERRNNAIRRIVLKTEDDANEFIEFTPKSVTGAPAVATIGQSFVFKVTGDLKVSGVAKEVTFDGTATFTSADEMKGTAQAKVHYPDFGVTVPNLSFLANVDQDTTLKLDFVAKK